MNKNITKVVLGGLMSLALSLSIGTNVTLASAPVVMTMNVTYTSTTATFTGYFNGNGSSSTDTEFFWGTSRYNLQTQHQTGFVTQNTGFGNFIENVSGLTPNTQYYVQAVAKNTATGETKYASQVLPFTTSSSPVSCNPSITADTYSVSDGGSVSLRPVSTGCGNPTITSSNGTFNDTPVVSGTTISSGILHSDTTFTIKAIDTAGVTHTSIPITIIVNQIIDPTCYINSFTSTNSIYYSGGSATLTWNTSGCSSGYITNGVGTVSSISNGSITVYPTSTTTYTLYAYPSGSGSQVSKSATVYVDNYNNNNGNNGYSGCTIYSFNASSYTVSPGESASLSWSSNCNYVTISNILGGAYLYANKSTSTGPLYYTTSYTIYGYGSNGNTVGTTVTIYVSGNNQPYYPTYSNPTPTTPTYTPSTTGGSVYTSVATNIGSRTARLNGLINSANAVSSYFEYGTNPSALNYSTEQQYVSGNVMNYYSTITVSPLSTYYFRAVANINGVLTKGNVVSFDTASVNSTSNIVYATSTTTSGIGNGTSGIELKINNKSDAVAIGDKAEYTITYQNGSNKTLSNVILSILFPQGYTLNQSSQGRLISPNNMEVSIGSLAPNQSGSVYVEVTIGQATAINQTLLTTATLNYTLPNNTRDSTVAYILNHASGMSALGGFALGSGFFPTTIFGWLLTIIIIFAIILAARRISRSGNGHGHAGHH